MAYLKAALALMFASGLVMYPDICAEAARTAMHTWAHSVAPALIPFAAVMPFLTCAEARLLYGRIFGPAVRRLFRLPAGAAPAIIAGLMSGSPAGAIAAANVAKEEGLSKTQTARLAGIACGVSPVYVISVLGASVSGSKMIGYRLAAAQLLAQLAAGVALSRFGGKDTAVFHNIEKTAPDRPVAAAVNAALRVCGYMTLFSVGIKLAETAAGPWIWKAAVFIDLPTGAAHCSKDVLLAAALGSGGMCICMQNLAVLRGNINVIVYVFHKLLTSGMCAGIYMLMSAGEKSAVFADIAPDGRIFEKNLLLIALIILPVTFIFLGKRPKKHFS